MAVQITYLSLMSCPLFSSETMITIDDTLTEEEIVETLKAHKQIIANIKTQNWPMHRKLRVGRINSRVHLPGSVF